MPTNDSLANFNVYNAVDVTTLQPRKSVFMPFPLENIDQEIADVYAKIDNIRKRLEVAKRSNVRNLSKGLQHDIKKAQYKLSTCMSLLRDFTRALDKLQLP